MAIIELEVSEVHQNVFLYVILLQHNSARSHAQVNVKGGISQFSAVKYGVPNVSKILANGIFVYLPLICKYDSDLSKCLSYMGMM